MPVRQGGVKRNLGMQKADMLAMHLMSKMKAEFNAFVQGSRLNWKFESITADYDTRKGSIRFELDFLQEGGDVEMCVERPKTEGEA